MTVMKPLAILFLPLGFLPSGIRATECIGNRSFWEDNRTVPRKAVLHYWPANTICNLDAVHLKACTENPKWRQLLWAEAPSYRMAIRELKEDSPGSDWVVGAIEKVDFRIERDDTDMPVFTLTFDGSRLLQPRSHYELLFQASGTKNWLTVGSFNTSQDELPNSLAWAADSVAIPVSVEPNGQVADDWEGIAIDLSSLPAAVREKSEFRFEFWPADMRTGKPEVGKPPIPMNRWRLTGNGYLVLRNTPCLSPRFTFPEGNYQFALRLVDYSGRASPIHYFLVNLAEFKGQLRKDGEVEIFPQEPAKNETPDPDTHPAKNQDSCGNSKR